MSHKKSKNRAEYLFHIVSREDLLKKGHSPKHFRRDWSDKMRVELKMISYFSTKSTLLPERKN
ncbi:hypothetical protein ADM90_02590 [Lysinibacillus macroides]|uniref:Uncharacterized protein n=1 Tax=Lysinibacillus macroides TaxID=33935 RepID=A0A0N0UXC2_9BACI|nr:hypothetical protein ADM90_02590 [Lysinibacillus macroides]